MVRMQFNKRDTLIMWITLHHLLDYANGDDRPDHGLGRLKDLRGEFGDEWRQRLAVICGRFAIAHRKEK